MNLRRATKARRERTGAAAVEAAIVLSLMVLIVFGIIEFGRALMVNQIITNAAREATRRAVIPGATDAEVNGIIATYMSGAGIKTYTKKLFVNGTEAALSTASSFDEIKIEIKATHSNTNIGVVKSLSGSRVFVARVVMRKE